jgi:ankyrin repeat protein
MNQSLHTAVAGGHRGAVTELLVAGANPNEQDASGNTPLHFASAEVMDLLLQAKADPNILNAFDQDAIDAHLYAGRFDNAKRLLDYPATQDPRSYGLPRLHRAAFSWQFEAVEKLIEWGHDPASVTGQGSTILHLVAWQASPAKRGEGTLLAGIKRLALLGAPLNVRDIERNTPLHVALKGGAPSPAAARALAEAGADIHMRDAEGRAPLRLAQNYLRRLRYAAAEAKDIAAAKELLIVLK